MANKSISQLDSASTLQGTDLIEIASDQGSSTYASKKTTVSAVETHCGTTATFSGLNTTNKTLVGAINEAAQSGGGGGSGGIDYSTSEQDTGLKWTDGKAIYQKTFVNYALGVSGDNTFLTSMATLGATKLIKVEGFIHMSVTGGTYHYMIGGYMSSSTHSGVGVTNAGNILIYHETSTNTQTADITLQYLKD